MSERGEMGVPELGPGMEQGDTASGANVEFGTKPVGLHGKYPTLTSLEAESTTSP